MHPTPDQIAVAAYHRWARRNHVHGRHVDDWLASEQELVFALNYEVVARYRLDGVAPRHLGEGSARRCRFCEGAPPRARFGDARPALPAALGNDSLLTLEVCEDCSAQFDESLGEELDRFLRAVRSGETEPARISIAAFKGLALAGLTLVPEGELQFFEDAVEWVSNPDHDLDSRSIGGVECLVHALPDPSPFAWAALARRTDDDAPYPYMVAFFGVDRHVFQVPLPLSARDEDLEGSIEVPRVASPFGVGRGPLEGRVAVIGLASAEHRRPSLFSFLGR